MDDISQASIESAEPQITSNDPNERKLARRLRTERRWIAIQNKALQAEEEEVELDEETKNPIQIQIDKSADLLKKFLYEGEEYVTNVRVANDSREVDRREAEGVNREKVIEQLDNEATEAQNIFEEIAVKWSVIQQYNDPLHIHEDINNQKEKCELLIKQKDAIINMLRDEIKNAERKFSRDQRKQNQDINDLTRRIEKQIIFMRHAYQTEFDLIEGVILDERKKLIESNDRQWEELYERRKEYEVENSELKEEQLAEYFEKMAELRNDFQEQHRAAKIKLGRDIEELQNEFERIKSLALLNSEKLDYNYQILKKKTQENLIIKSQQKRRLNKLHDVISDLKKKISDYEKTTNDRIKKLTDDVMHLKKNILDIEAKADHFAKVNDDKFHQIWEMNKHSCESALKKILDADRVLYEQQLGIEWVAPEITGIEKPALPSYKEAVEILKKNVDGDTDSKNKTLLTATKKEELEKNEVSPHYRNLLKNILTQVSDRSGFLTESKLKKILKPYLPYQGTLVKLDIIFQSLGVTHKRDIDLLAEYFVPLAYCPTCYGMDAETDTSLTSRFTTQLSRMSSKLSRISHDHIEILELEDAFGAIQQPEQIIDKVVMELVTTEVQTDKDTSSPAANEGMDDICGGIMLDQLHNEMTEKRGLKKQKLAEEKILCQYAHPLQIKSVHIIMALKNFVADYYKKRISVPTTQERIDRKRYTISRLLDESDIEFYWSKFKDVYDAEKIRVWDGLLEGLKKYHEILTDRKSLCEEVVSLRRQNENLKRLLSNYLVQKEHLDPPCALERDRFPLSGEKPSYIQAKLRNK